MFSVAITKRIILVGGAAMALGIIVYLVACGSVEQPQVLLSDGRLFRIEAVTYGTNHVVGWNDWWLVPLRKVLPSSIIQALTPAKGQSREGTDRPALVVWVNAQDATGKYTDCQRVRVCFIDERGDVYPENTTAHGAFAKGFNRGAHIFYVFPRRSTRLRLELCPWRSGQPSTIFIDNPCQPAREADWKAEDLPVARRIGNVELTLESLAIHTNGGPGRSWEPVSLHWEPVFRLEVSGMASTNWQAPEWEAQDTTGNRGQTLGLHEAVQWIKATVYPKPEAVNQEAQLWEIPVTRLPAAPQSLLWNTNRLLRDLSITVVGLFPPGSYTFNQGLLTNAPMGVSSMNGWTGIGQQVLPGRWQWWSTHGSTNYTSFLKWSAAAKDQRIAVGLTYHQGEGLQTEWGRSEGGGDLRAFVFDHLPPDAQPAKMVVVLQEPLHAEFFVRPPLASLKPTTAPR